MHDIKAIRADWAGFNSEIARRGTKLNGIELLHADEKYRGLQLEIEQRRADSREADRLYYRMNKEVEELTAKVSTLPQSDGLTENPLFVEWSDKLDRMAKEINRNARITGTARVVLPALDALERQALEERDNCLATLPNLPAPDVPDGLDESSNEERKQGKTAIPILDFAPKEHDTLALRFGYDPDAAAAISGARFAVLMGPLARLHRALGNWMLSRNSAAGWTEVAPPILVKPHAMFGTGQLPKFADDAFATTDGRYLIPTAEVSLTNLIRGKVLDRDALPLRFTALTPCFRSEAGSAGRDTRGLIRQHQFDKVELVSIVADADAAAAEHEAMTAQAESLLDALGLPYRRMLLCAGDMGFSARKTYDLEVWLPGQGQYREISSVSDCGDFQARRMDVDEPKGGRFRTRGVKGTSFVHTLNGSALAVGRTLVAVLENYQRADGSVVIPEVLRMYMGGVEALTPN